MSDLSKINIDGTVLNISDDSARSNINKANRDIAKANSDINTIQNNLANINPTVQSLLKTKVDWINAIEYGFSTHTANDDIMQSFISNNSNDVLYFPKGTYTFKHGFNFPNEMHLLLHPNATLKLLGQSDSFITIRKNSTLGNYATTSFLIGGTIDGNYLANTIFGCSKVIGTLLENVNILHVLKYGIQTSMNTTPDGSAFFNNIKIENTKNVNEIEQANTTGIYDNGFDNKFNNVEIINIQTGILTYNGTFDNIHCWIRSKNIVPKSRAIYCDGYNVSLSNIVADTYNYGIVINGVKYYGCSVTNYNFILNTYVYDSNLLKLYTPICFEYSIDFSGTVSIKATNVFVDSKAKFKTSNFSPLSSFVNVHSTVPLKNIPNVVSTEQTLSYETITSTTDEYGQLSVNNFKNVIGLYITSTSDDITYVVRKNGVIEILKVNLGVTPPSFSLAPNTRVTLHITYANLYLS